jgi:hypothetical protein
MSLSLEQTGGQASASLSGLRKCLLWAIVTFWGKATAGALALQDLAECGSFSTRDGAFLKFALGCFG